MQHHHDNDVINDTLTDIIYVTMTPYSIHPEKSTSQVTIHCITMMYVYPPGKRKLLLQQSIKCSMNV